MRRTFPTFPAGVLVSTRSGNLRVGVPGEESRPQGRWAPRSATSPACTRRPAGAVGVVLIRPCRRLCCPAAAFRPLLRLFIQLNVRAQVSDEAREVVG